MSLSDAILSLSTGTYTVTRPGAGTWTNGVFVEGTASTFQIQASVQPASARDLLRLPEGERTSDVIAIYTPTELRASSQPDRTLSDRITYRGALYELEHVEFWESGGFWKCLARKIER
jgi:hypothetical protein